MSETASDHETAVADDADRSSAIPASRNLPLGLWVIALLLAVLYPGLFSEHIFVVHAFRPVLYFSMTLLVAFGSIIAWVLLHFLVLKRDMRRSAGILAVVIVVVFSWPIWTEIGDSVAGLGRVGLLADLVPVVLAAALLWAAFRYADRDPFILVTAGVLICALSFLIYSLAPRVVVASEGAFGEPAPGSKPNVIVLVLDGYARADVLDSEYGFDNTPFIDALAERGFQIRSDALTNYSITHTSLSSLIDAGYPFDEGTFSDESWNRMRHLLSGDGAIVHAFESAGYETVMFENAWSGSNCSGALDRCHRTGLVSRSLWALGQISPMAAIQRTTQPNPFTSVSLQHIRELGDVIDDDAEAPLFVLAHATVPHPPVQLDASCEFVVASDRVRLRLSSSGASEEERQVARRHYVDQLRCINDEVTATIDRLIAADEDIEIVILSDHGPASYDQVDQDAAEWTDGELIERLSVLSAVRLSDECPRAEPARTTVNTIRRAANCALGTDLADLPDRIFLAPAVGFGAEPVVEITDRMNDIAHSVDE